MATNLRQLAKDRQCQVRAPGCNFDPTTTVLAHLNGAGLSQKHPDLLGAWACSACHDFVDNRAGVAASTTRRLYHLEGMARTIATLLAEGVLIVRSE